MVKKTLLISGAVLGALAVGSQSISADTVQVNDGTSTGTSQPSTQPSDTGSTTLPPANSGKSANTNTGSTNGSSSANTGSSGINDGTTVDNSGSGSSSTSNTGSGGSATDANTGSSSTTGGGSSSSSTDTITSSSSTSDKGGTSSTPADNANVAGTSSTSTDNGDTAGTTTDTGSGSAPSKNDDTKLPTNGKAPDVVSLTPTTPDVNDKGQLNQVTPIPVAQPSQGQAPVVPAQVASVPSVARAVETYNATLADNNSDATQAPVLEAKKQVDEAVQQALPKTGVRENKSSVSVIGVLLATLASGLAFVFKKKLI